MVIETPKGRRNKFDYDPRIEAFTPGGLLAEGLRVPFDFGFGPSTVAEDGDPLDVMVGIRHALQKPPNRCPRFS